MKNGRLEKGKSVYSKRHNQKVQEANINEGEIKENKERKEAN